MFKACGNMWFSKLVFQLLKLAIIVYTLLELGRCDHGKYMYTSFQQGIICNSEHRPVLPKTLLECQEIVEQALKTGSRIKAFGSLHSATDIICTEGIPVGMQNIDHFSYDHSSGLVTAGAGLTLDRFLENLHALGRTVSGVPTFGGITLGGATATGSHGSSFGSFATLSDQIVRVVIVDGNGNVKNVTNPETLRAFRAHLGLLGIIYEITLPTIPQYKVRVRHFMKPDNVLWDGATVNKLLNSSDRFQYFWFPSSKVVVMSVSTRTEQLSEGNCQTNFIPGIPSSIAKPSVQALETMQEDANHFGYFAFQTYAKLYLYKAVPYRAPIYSTEDGKTSCPQAVGYSHKMYSNVCNNCPWHVDIQNWDIEVIIPLSELQNAMTTMRNIMHEYPVEFPLTGIYFRFVPAGDGLLSANSGQDSVGIEWILMGRKDRRKPMMGLPASQAMMQALITKHGGRAHWAKNGPVYTHRPLLPSIYPELETFISHMHEFDPHGVFLNDFGRRLKFGSDKSAMDSYVEHCALLDVCLCQNNMDCGDDTKNAYICGELQGFPVCRERPEGYQHFKSQVQRHFIRKFVNLWSTLIKTK